MSILITGGCGFIAKNLILHSLPKTSRIICLDNFISSIESDFKEFLENNHLPNVEYHKWDIIKHSETDLKDAFGQVDEIYHFASLASPISYKRNPLETLDVGYIGTRNILMYALKCNAKVLFSSTSEVYGDSLITPQSEDYYGNVNSFGERSSYDCSKRVAEALCFTFIQDYNLDVKIARIFNTYGEYMMINDSRIITECIKHLMNGTELTVYGDGTQTRSFCHVQDTVEMLYLLMQSSYNSPVNIGCNQEISVNDTIKIISKVYREEYGQCGDLLIKYTPLTQNDPLQRRPCLIKNNEIIGTRTFIKLEDGAKRMIEFFVHKKNEKKSITR